MRVILWTIARNGVTRVLMKSAYVSLVSCAAAWLQGSGFAGAATIQTVGAGSAVSVADRLATFDALNSTSVVHLENYTEGGLKIMTAADSWAADFAMAAQLDPFGGAGGADRAFYAISAGNNDWVAIQTTNSVPMYGVEFMYGNTWTTGNSQVPWGSPDAVVDWQAWLNGTIVTTGTVGPVPMLQLGTILGFFDPAGFDQLLVRATNPRSGDPTLQAIALDNLAVMLTNRPPLPVIYASDFTVDRVSGVASLTVADTLPGLNYRMVYTESLSSSAWIPVPAQQPDGWVVGGGTLSFADFGAAGKPQRFYRVEVR